MRIVELLACALFLHAVVATRQLTVMLKKNTLQSIQMSQRMSGALRRNSSASLDHFKAFPTQMAARRTSMSSSSSDLNMSRRSSSPDVSSLKATKSDPNMSSSNLFTSVECASSDPNMSSLNMSRRSSTPNLSRSPPNRKAATYKKGSIYRYEVGNACGEFETPVECPPSSSESGTFETPNPLRGPLKVCHVTKGNRNRIQGWGVTLQQSAKVCGHLRVTGINGLNLAHNTSELQVGDVIEQINGDPLDEVPFSATMERLGSVKAGRTCAFTIRRAKQGLDDASELATGPNIAGPSSRKVENLLGLERGLRVADVENLLGLNNSLRVVAPPAAAVPVEVAPVEASV